MFVFSFIWVFWKKNQIFSNWEPKCQRTAETKVPCLWERKKVVFLYNSLLKTVTWPLLVTDLYQRYTSGNLHRNCRGLPLFGVVQEINCEVTKEKKKKQQKLHQEWKKFWKCNSSWGASSPKGSKKHAHFPWPLVKGAYTFITHHLSKFV